MSDHSPVSPRRGNAAYRALLFVAHAAVRSFYRVRCFVDPRTASGGRPVIVVANHPNAGIDPVLVAGAFDRPLRFLAKSGLFQAPVLSTVLRLVGALPAHRRVDGSDTSKNEAMFGAAHAALRAGDAVAIFPEGTSHADPDLRELRTGAARLALGAARDGIDVAFVPVGLLYDQRDRFRSLASVWVGPALGVRDWLIGRGVDPGAFDPQDPVLVRTLTAGVAEALDQVSFTAPDTALLDLARMIAAADGDGEDGRPDALTWWAARLETAQRSSEGSRVVGDLRAFFEHLNEVGFNPVDLEQHPGDDKAPGLVAGIARSMAVLPVAGLGAAAGAPA